jgi:hypothetical protein
MIIAHLFAGMLSSMNIYVDKLSDIRIHLNDFYMICLMFGWMLLFDNMHNTNSKLLIVVFIIIVFLCIRSQFLISDEEYLNGMIPHHSMAITMSKRILEKTNNSKIRNLANKIIYSQMDEIEEMNKILI